MFASGWIAVHAACTCIQQALYKEDMQMTAGRALLVKATDCVTNILAAGSSIGSSLLLLDLILAVCMALQKGGA